MLRIYLTTTEETASVNADGRLSEYRLSKARGKNAPVILAAGLLLDYALKPFSLSERGMEYGENAHGKPFFINRSDIHFSLSHSGKYALCAVSDTEVGADVQKYEDRARVFDIAKKYFTAAEYEYLKTRSEAEFFRLWTRKESLLKALGTGISGGLSQYEILRDEICADGVLYRFSQPCVCENACVTVCARERAAHFEFVTREMLCRMS